MARLSQARRDFRSSPPICPICDKPLTWQQVCDAQQGCSRACSRAYKLYLRKLFSGVRM